MEISAEEKKKAKAQHVMRKRIADEIFETEQSYVNNLNVLVQQLIRPLEGAKVMTQAEIYLLVSNWTELAVFHDKFLTQLRELMRTWNEHTSISALFIELVGKMQIYQAYMTNYNRAALYLIYLSRKNSTLLFILKGFEEHMKRTTRLPIESVFIMPVQRIPRYSLLLRVRKRSFVIA